MHPNQAQIFKLWQIYLENVNPLLKITHTPTLQARIIDAASDMTSTSPPLEALMFSIYCIAVFSLGHEKCLEMFGAPRQDVLRGYQLATREALLNCGFLKTSDRDCLTALHLYLVRYIPASKAHSNRFRSRSSPEQILVPYLLCSDVLCVLHNACAFTMSRRIVNILS